MNNNGPTILKSNLMKNVFWKDVLQSYTEFFYKVHIDSEDDVITEPLFYNDTFKINGKVIESTHGQTQVFT
jgi:hypothetical protein